MLLRPSGSVVLTSISIFVDGQAVHHCGKKLRLNAPNCHELTISSHVAAVERHGPVQQVCLTLRAPLTKARHTMDKAHQTVGAIDNGCINYITFTRPAALDQRRKDTVDEKHRPAAEITHHIERRYGGLPILTNCV